LCGIREKWRDLENAAEELELAYGYTKVQLGRVIVSEPFSARQQEWGPFRDFLYKQNVHNVVMTPFMHKDKDMAQSLYLLGAIRRAEEDSVEHPIKVVLITNRRTRLMRAGLTTPMPTNRCLLINAALQGRRRIARAIRAAAGTRKGRYLFVDDLEQSRDFLRRVADNLRVRDISDFCNFNEAHDLLRNRGYKVAAVVIDAREQMHGMTGIGMSWVIRSVARLNRVPIVMFSMKFVHDEDLYVAARPIDGIFSLGPGIASRIHAVLA